eukprot:672756-Pelagomonas_calceolata.AAC.1
MNQQYDVILGQDWFLKTGVVLDYTMRAISVKRHGYRCTIKSAKSEPETASMQPANVHSASLNVAQLKRISRQPCA